MHQLLTNKIVLAILVIAVGLAGYITTRSDSDTSQDDRMPPQPRPLEQAPALATQTSKLPELTQRPVEKNSAEVHEDAKPPELFPSGSISELSELVEFIEKWNADPRYLDYAFNLLSESAEAFDYVAQAYLNENDPDKKETLLLMLDTNNSPQKIPLASDFAASEDPEERLTAYKWLNDAGESITSEGFDVLLNAMYFEQDPSLLFDLMSQMRVPDETKRRSQFEATVTRLNELAFHEDRDIAIEAISNIAYASKTEDTQRILKEHIEGRDEDRREAALNALYQFDRVNDDMMNSLQLVILDPDSSEVEKSIAKDLIFEFENNKAASEN